MKNSDTTHFHGSYLPTDVQFLLKPMQLAMTPVEEKERLIQSGEKHYSEMLSQEPAPSAAHLAIFNQALDLGGPRLARDVVALAKGLIHSAAGEPIILVSLVRAGVPLGVMLQRALKEMGYPSYHYGISIIRDRGIDEAALSLIEARHGTAGIVFVDGWTGKGAITRQLSASLKGRIGYPETPRLVVLADPAGCAWLAASDEDWLIPFGIMGAPVSGMVSRSIWQEGGFHGCVHCQHLSEYDCSLRMVDTVDRFRRALSTEVIPAAIEYATQTGNQWLNSQNLVAQIATEYGIESKNRIKPGIAEATRAVLRRVPDHVLVRNRTDQDVSLLVHLAEAKGIIVKQRAEIMGPYRAITIIKKVT